MTRKRSTLILRITPVILILLFGAMFSIKEYKEHMNEGAELSINATGDLEINYKIVETGNQSCSEDRDCETPETYLMRSSCPYTSKCIQKTCAVICPDVDPKWREIQKAINNCEVTSIFQNHQNEVEATLKSGVILKAIEPNIDVIFDIVTNARSKCGDIQMATE